MLEIFPSRECLSCAEFFLGLGVNGESKRRNAEFGRAKGARRISWKLDLNSAQRVVPDTSARHLTTLNLCP